MHGTKMGQPTVLSEKEELMMVDMVKLLADGRFPFSGDDLVKSYLNKKGGDAKRFIKNLS